MAFDQKNFAPVGAQSTLAPGVYSYITTDTLAEVLTPGYLGDKAQQLNENDRIVTVIGGSVYELILKADGDLKASSTSSIKKSINFNWNTNTVNRQQGFLGITNNGVGDKTFNFDGDMPDLFYGVQIPSVMTGIVFRAIVIGIADNSSGSPNPGLSKTVSSVRLLASFISTASSTGPLTDDALDCTLLITDS